MKSRKKSAFTNIVNMSQDIVADALNQIMNAKRAGKKDLELKRFSKLLLSVLAIAKLNKYIKNYKADGIVILIVYKPLVGVF